MSTNKYYKLSAELLTLPLTPRAVLLYAILADRQELSRKNSNAFKDKDGCYIIYTVSDICTALGIGDRTARYALAELEDEGLITTKKQGKSLPQKIYVHDVSDRSDRQKIAAPDRQKIAAPDRQKIAAPDRQKIAAPDRQKIAALNSSTNTNNTDISSSSPAATASRLPELLKTIDECAAELRVQLDDKARLKLLRKIQKHGKGIHALKPWLLTVMSSSSVLDSISDDDDSGKGYQPSYDIAEYESTSVLDEDWDD